MAAGVSFIEVLRMRLFRMLTGREMVTLLWDTRSLKRLVSRAVCFFVRHLEPWRRLKPCSTTYTGWIRLQNGYYLPMQSDDGKIPFLHKVSKRAHTLNTEMKRIGSNTPLFRGAEQEDVTSMLGGKVAVVDVPPPANGVTEMEESSKVKEDTLRAAVHMDAMAFGMGCCCLQITFQAKDVDESRFIFDHLNVMAPM